MHFCQLEWCGSQYLYLVQRALLKGSQLCSLVINPLTFTSNCLADVLVRELVVVTQHFPVCRGVLLLHAGVHTGNMSKEQGKLQRFLQQCSSSVCCGSCYLTIMNSSLTGSGDLP